MDRVDAPIRLTVWSDFLCPWCYVGAYRMHDLEELYGDRIDVQWRSHVLQPTARAKPLDRFRRYTERWSAPGGPGAYEPRCEFRTWGDEAAPTHSIPAAVAAKAVGRINNEVLPAFRLALFRAYFTEHRDISDAEVLSTIASEHGVDPSRVSDTMRADGAALSERVLAEHVEGIELGAHAAPTVVLNDVLPIPGAQDLDTYTRMIDRILTRRASTT